MNDPIEIFTQKVNEEVQKHYGENNYGIDPLTIIAIINIIYNIYKAIMIIYFLKEDKDIVNSLQHPNFLTRVIIGREVRKALKDSSSDHQDVTKGVLINVIRQYGESELKTLLSQIREKKNER